MEGEQTRALGVPARSDAMRCSLAGHDAWLDETHRRDSAGSGAVARRRDSVESVDVSVRVHARPAHPSTMHPTLEQCDSPYVVTLRPSSILGGWGGHQLQRLDIHRSRANALTGTVSRSCSSLLAGWLLQRLALICLSDPAEVKAMCCSLSPSRPPTARPSLPLSRSQKAT